MEIFGLKFRVTGTELKRMCAETAKYHATKADYYQKQAEVMKEATADLQDALPNQSGKTSYGNPVEGMEEKARSHRKEVKQYEWMSEHVVIEKDYMLDMSDIHRFF